MVISSQSLIKWYGVIRIPSVPDAPTDAPDAPVRDLRILYYPVEVKQPCRFLFVFPGNGSFLETESGT